jgi:hypothetical protein
MATHQIFTYVSAIFGIIAAGLWLVASTTCVKADYNDPWPQDEDGKPLPYLTLFGGRGPITRTTKGILIDITATASSQNRWNAIAAACASAAAIAQAFALVTP